MENKEANEERKVDSEAELIRAMAHGEAVSYRWSQDGYSHDDGSGVEIKFAQDGSAFVLSLDGQEVAVDSNNPVPVVETYRTAASNLENAFASLRNGDVHRLGGEEALAQAYLIVEKVNSLLAPRAQD